jgi:iron complex outermembrane receptor protein
MELGSRFRYNEDDRVERFGGIVNTNELRLALLDTNPATAFNPFGIKQNTQAALDRVFTTTERHGRTSLTLEDLKVNGDLFSLPAGPVSFALGGEHRTEQASDAPDALTASGQTIGSTNFGATNGSRDVWSLYWEVRLPVTSPAWKLPGLYSLELDYQERFENFSDSGATERPKFFLRWQPIDSALTIRATYSEAYHAPTLNDLFAVRFSVTARLSQLSTRGARSHHRRIGSTSLRPRAAIQISSLRRHMSGLMARS